MNELFSDYFEQSYEMKFEKSLISMIKAHSNHLSVQCYKCTTGELL